MFICKQKWTLSFNLLKYIWTLKNTAIWLAKNILIGNNSRTTLPDLWFAMESQESKELTFWIVFRKKMINFSKKNAKHTILGRFLPKIGQKIGFCHFLASMVP